MIRVSFPFAAHVAAVLQRSEVVPLASATFPAGARHVDRRRIVEEGRRQWSADRSCAGLAHEEVLARRERSGELRQLARVRAEESGARRARVLERLAVQRDGRSAAVEDLDVVVRVGRTRVPAATVDLADHEIRRRTVRDRGAGGACERDERSETHSGEREARADVTHQASPLRRLHRMRRQASAPREGMVPRL